MFLFGLLLGILYLQRSVAIFYMFPVLLFYYFYNKENFIKQAVFICLGLLIVLLFVGLHNYKRSGIFYIISTQAKDGLYIYLTPNILAEKKNYTVKKARNQLDKKKIIWMKKENIDLRKEEDRLKHYDYQRKIAFNVMLKNPITSLKVVINRTMHFVVIDPLSHVYYFHRWNYDNGHFYQSKEHKKWIIPRILYSFIIYFFCFLGVKNIYNEKKYRIFLLYFILSILYFTLVQSWYGGTRYFAPILIYLSFLFSFGFESFLRVFKR